MKFLEALCLDMFMYFDETNLMSPISGDVASDISLEPETCGEKFGRGYCGEGFATINITMSGSITSILQNLNFVRRRYRSDILRDLSHVDQNG